MLGWKYICTDAYVVGDAHRLRQLLADLLRSDSDLNAFGLDHFRDVYSRFGHGMDRTQKENLLLLHAPSHADLVEALRQRFPNARVWLDWPTTSDGPMRVRSVARCPVSTSRTTMFLVASVAGAAVLGLLSLPVWSPLHSQGHVPARGASMASATGCGALSIDDLFLVKHPEPALSQQLVLDVRLRQTGSAPTAVNITRAKLQLLDQTPERAPYEPSASYDLLVSGEHSEAALAQRVGPSEIDRILLHLGFTRETAAYQYTAKLQLLYNRGCQVDSEPFVLSVDAARWPSDVAPWREH